MQCTNQLHLTMRYAAAMLAMHLCAAAYATAKTECDVPLDNPALNVTALRGDRPNARTNASGPMRCDDLWRTDLCDGSHVAKIRHLPTAAAQNYAPEQHRNRCRPLCGDLPKPIADQRRWRQRQTPNPLRHNEHRQMGVGVLAQTRKSLDSASRQKFCARGKTDLNYT